MNTVEKVNSRKVKSPSLSWIARVVQTCEHFLNIQTSEGTFPSAPPYETETPPRFEYRPARLAAAV